MSKNLFYLGVIASALAAVLLVGHSAADAALQTALFGSDVITAVITPVLPVYMLLLAVPLAALFLRMASLLAARNLFSAFLAAFAVVCAGFMAVVLSTIQFRIALLSRGMLDANASALQGLAELRSIGLYALGWFLAMAFLALRPYFRIQASRALATLVYLPAPLYLLMLVSEVQAASPNRAAAPFWLALALLLMASAVHALRHRHLFVEVTNLRELLDGRVDPAGGSRPPHHFPMGNGVAFDS